MNTVISTPYALIVSREIERNPLLANSSSVYLFLEPDGFPRKIPERLTLIGEVPLKKISGKFQPPPRFNGMDTLLDIIDRILLSELFYEEGLRILDRFFTQSFRTRALQGYFRKAFNEILLNASGTGMNESYEEFFKLSTTIFGLITGMSLFEADDNFSSILNDVDRIVKKDSLLRIS